MPFVIPNFRPYRFRLWDPTNLSQNRGVGQHDRIGSIPACATTSRPFEPGTRCAAGTGRSVPRGWVNQARRPRILHDTARYPAHRVDGTSRPRYRVSGGSRNGNPGASRAHSGSGRRWLRPPLRQQQRGFPPRRRGMLAAASMPSSSAHPLCRSPRQKWMSGSSQIAATPDATQPPPEARVENSAGLLGTRT